MTLELAGMDAAVFADGDALSAAVEADPACADLILMARARGGATGNISTRKIWRNRERDVFRLAVACLTSHAAVSVL